MPPVRFGPLVVLLVGLAACGPRTRVAESDFVPLPVSDLGAVVARVGNVPVYGNQVLAEARRSGKTPREALADLVSSHLLAERARGEGWRPLGPSDPEITSVLVQRFLERDLEPSLRAESVPDSVLRPLYEQAKASFVHPRLVEIGLLAIYTGPLMKPAPREERARTAAELASYLKAHPPGTLDEFKSVARDPAWSSRAVVYRRFLQSSDQPLPAKVGGEIVKLRSPGEMTPLLTDEHGFFFARYVGERSAENIAFEMARDRLRAAYLDRWQRQQFDAFTGKLMQEHKVEAYFDRIPANETGP